jgi:hypothetical protein
MPTREHYGANSALGEETVAMCEAAKAELDPLEHVLRTALAQEGAPTTANSCEESRKGNPVQPARLRHMRLSREDLTMAAGACHALAERYREDPISHENTILRDAVLERARHADRLAHLFERQRDRF